MNPLTFLTKETVKSAISSVADGAAQIIGKFVKDPNEAAQASKEITLMAMDRSNSALETIEKSYQIETKEKSSIMKSEINSDDKLTKWTRPIILLGGFAMIILDFIFSWVNALFIHIDMTDVVTIPALYKISLNRKIVSVDEQR